MGGASMSSLDLALVAVIALSALAGVLRGLVREALSLAVWIGAAWVALRHGETGAALLGDLVASPELRLWAGRLLTFVVLVFAGSLLTWVVGYLIRHSALTGTDRLLGLLFGVARGVLVVGLAALALQAGGFATEPWWRQSKLLPYAAAVGRIMLDVAREQTAPADAGQASPGQPAPGPVPRD
jgi:membrane protein required for colicin V production